MKKITLLLLLVFSQYFSAQCLTASHGQWPEVTVPISDCSGSTPTILTEEAYAGEYSKIDVAVGETYIFSSSVATDIITIGTSDGSNALVFGPSPVLWVSTLEGEVRFYTHTNVNCGESMSLRARSVTCGPPPSCSAPTNILISAITDSTAHVAWNESLSNPSAGYDYIISTVNTEPDLSSEPTNSLPVGTSSLELKSLSAMTQYYFWIRSNCGNEKGLWIVKNFSTGAMASDCASATVISGCNEVVTATLLAGSGAWSIATCGFTTPGAEIVYSFTPAVTGQHNLQIISASGGYIDYFYKIAGDCSAAGWTCIDDNNGAGTDPIGILQAGTEYWILLDSEGTTARSASFKITCPPTCTNGTATYTVVSGCVGNEEQFFVDVAITNMGTAATYTISDNQGSMPLQLSALGIVQFGPYPNNTSVIFTVANADDASCVLTSTSRTQTICAPNCANAIPITACGEEVTVVLAAGTGAWSPGTCGFGTPGTEMLYSFTPEVTGQYNLQIISATGGYIDYFYKVASGTCDATGWTCIDDNNGAGTDPIGILQAGTEYLFLLDGEAVTARSATFKITCPPTCTNGTATYTVVSGCANGEEQFSVDVTLTTMGTAASYTISDNQGSAAIQLSAIGTVQFGPYSNGTAVIFTVANDNDTTCVLTSPIRTQTVCPPNCSQATVIPNCGEEVTVALADGTGAWNVAACGFTTPGTERLFSFTPAATGQHNLQIVSATGGYIDYFYKAASGTCDTTGWTCIDDNNGAGIDPIGILQAGTEYWILLDSEGTTARSATFKITCPPTCTNGTATYTTVSGCGNGEQQFFVDVAITAMGTATSYSVSDNQGSANQQLSSMGTLQFGPYPNATQVIFTVTNENDATCVLTSAAITQTICPPDCSGATPIICGENVLTTLTGAGAWNVSACGFTTPGAEQLYSFTPTETGLYSLQVVSSTGGYVDYFYKLASGTCNQTGWTCIGDANGAETNSIGILIAGMQYLILLDGESTAAKTITFKVSCAIAPLVNDTCSGATAITTFPYTNSQDATGATNNNGFIGCGATASMNDGVWYSFVGDGGNITVTATPTGWDAELGIYTGICGNFTCIVSRDVALSGAAESYVINNTVAGTTYYVNVGHYSGTANNSEGPFVLSVTSTVLGVDTTDLSNFSYYPNPVKNILNLSYTDSITEVAIYNLLGQKILQNLINKTHAQIDMSGLASGNYVVKVSTGNQIKTVKVLKE